ncbi:hypothetical protein [Marispirochaeta sp.]|uniref:hypothetical protein n=1 Tax=Marispirochaeta sp. TaxID=2038653 RepID=UPI0029C6C994|nr:hypothetical protein [Marispirochaeta sp.]
MGAFKTESLPGLPDSKGLYHLEPIGTRSPVRLGAAEKGAFLFQREGRRRASLFPEQKPVSDDTAALIIRCQIALASGESLIVRLSGEVEVAFSLDE